MAKKASPKQQQVQMITGPVLGSDGKPLTITNAEFISYLPYLRIALAVVSKTRSELKAITLRLCEKGGKEGLNQLMETCEALEDLDRKFSSAAGFARAASARLIRSAEDVLSDTKTERKRRPRAAKAEPAAA